MTVYFMYRLGVWKSSYVIPTSVPSESWTPPAALSHLDKVSALFCSCCKEWIRERRFAYGEVFWLWAVWAPVFAILSLVFAIVGFASPAGTGIAVGVLILLNAIGPLVQGVITFGKLPPHARSFSVIQTVQVAASLA
jgi:hypothetical protein